jgi:hypothetical protein
MAATDDDPALVANRARFWQARYETARVIVDRAIDRREVPAGTDPELALELLVAPLHFRKLLTRQPIDDGLVEHMATHSCMDWSDSLRRRRPAHGAVLSMSPRRQVLSNSAFCGR